MSKPEEPEIEVPDDFDALAYYAKLGSEPEMEEIFETPVVSDGVTGDVLKIKKPADKKK
jgi:hypothetical protein